MSRAERPRRAGRRAGALGWVASALVLAACGGGSPERQAERSPSAPVEIASAPDAAPRIVFLGDSLTAGLGVSPVEAYPAVIQQRLRAGGYPHAVVNAGVSGDTSAGGLRRLDWSLQGRVEVLVLALGANDGLRGLGVEELERNLGAIVERAHARHVQVLLAGMEAPPNFGPAYTRQFSAVYAGLAEKHGVAFVPFLLAGVAGVPALNQSDGIHPNPEGHRVIADLVWRQLEPMLASRHTS